MPVGRGPRRIIPILKRNLLEFRFVGGRLNTEKTGSSIVWASCATQNGLTKPAQPSTITRTLGSIGGLVTFQVAKPLKFSQPCGSDLSQQTKRTPIRQ